MKQEWSRQVVDGQHKIVWQAQISGPNTSIFSGQFCSWAEQGTQLSWDSEITVKGQVNSVDVEVKRKYMLRQRNQVRK